MRTSLLLPPGAENPSYAIALGGGIRSAPCSSNIPDVDKRKRLAAQTGISVERLLNIWSTKTVVIYSCDPTWL